MQTAAKMRKNLDAYEVGLAKIHFEEFFWHDFCDMYLELVKLRVYQPERFVDGDMKKLSGQYTLYQVMFMIIRMLAPYLPHVTEDIYQEYFRKFEGGVSLHKTQFPYNEDASSKIQAPSSLSFEPVLQVVAEVRKYKTEKQISLGAEIDTLTITAPADQLVILQSVEDDIIGVTKAKVVEYREGEFEIVIS